MELRDLLSVIRRFWLVAAVVFALAMAIGLTAALVPAKRYASTATLLVTPASGSDYNAVSAVQSLLPSFADEVGNETFAKQVKASVEQLHPSQPWTSVTLSGSAVAGTSLLRAEAESTDRHLASLAANAAADNLIRTRIASLVQMKVIDRARVATAPVSPRKKLILFAAGAIGLIFGLLAALGANAVWPRVRTAGEIWQRFGLEVIAEIPQVHRFPRNPRQLFDGEALHPKLLEAYRRLHSNFEIVAGGLRMVGVVSCTAGEGKSSVVANLGWAVASTGRQVVLVDADLRRPSLHGYFGVGVEPGVADAGEVNARRLVRDTALPTLHILPAGIATEHPTSVIYTVLPRIIGAFDDTLLLVDMPPLLGTAEASLVASAIRSVILVVDARHGHPSELERVLHELERAGVKVLGVALNHVRPRRFQRRDAYYYSTTVSR